MVWFLPSGYCHSLLKLAIFLLLSVCLPTTVRSARILAVCPLFASSHHRFYQPILASLAQAGHEVVVYSPFPHPDPPPNYTNIQLEDPPNTEFINRLVKELQETPQWRCIDHFIDVVEVNFEYFLKNQKLQQLLVSNERFDLLIVEAFIHQEFLLMFGHKFKAPVISLQSIFPNSILNSVFGNDLSLSYMPEMCSPFPNKMTFFQRLQTFVYVTRGLSYIYYNKFLSKQDSMIQKHFPGTPPVLDLINNVSLVFVNDHPTANYAHPRTQTIIPVGGIHLQKEKPLPPDIQKFVDEASHGVILFSLGTYVPDHLEPNYYFNMYIQVFRQLNQRIVWKTKMETIENLPPNVMISNWVPQRDLLAHPNTVLFLTHGGMLSLHETIHCGVPVVCIPQFCDQFRNSAFYEAMGIGKHLATEDLSVTNILTAIRTVLDNPSYKDNVKRLSRIHRDLPRTPAQSVVYWTEYVLRHRGAPHLKPASTHLAWYQLYLLDVIGVLLFITAFGISIVYIVIQKILKTIFGKTLYKKIKKS